jgi:hypothetical protein
MLTAILGAGPIGSAIAQRLAERERVREIRLIDDAGSVAAGKALDIRQAGPIGGYDTPISTASDPLAAAGADVVVFADTAADGEWEGERGLAMVQRLVRAGCTAAFVFAGAKQTWLMEAAARELHVAGERLIGTAAAAIPPTVSALLHIETGESGARVSVAGRPPVFVIGWSTATIGGRLVTESVPAHRLLAISQSLPKLWPPGPQAIAAPTALVVEALGSGSRPLLSGTVITDGEYGTKGMAALLQVELGHRRILRRVVPSQSQQERTETANAILKSAR